MASRFVWDAKFDCCAQCGFEKEIYCPEEINGFMLSVKYLGRLPFVRTDRSVRIVRKWNASVLRTERTGSGPAGPTLGVGPTSSLAPTQLHA